jgi:hypothetical protein
MTKVTKNRTYDAAAEFKKPEGQALKGFIDDQITGDELTFRILRNGISFGDNVNCVVKDLDLLDGVAQVIGIDKPVDMMLVGRVLSREFGLSQPLHWYYNDRNQLEVVAHFSGTPTVAVKVRAVILFQ